LKDCLAEKEVEGCNFAPQLATKRKGDCQEKRNLEKFLED